MHGNTAQQSDVSTYMTHLGQSARSASAVIANATTGDKNAALEAIGQNLLDNETKILQANSKDLRAGKQNNLSAAPDGPAGAE